MTDFATLLLLGTVGVVAVGFLANALAFVPADRFPLLRLVDGKAVRLPG